MHCLRRAHELQQTPHLNSKDWGVLGSLWHKQVLESNHENIR